MKKETGIPSVNRSCPFYIADETYSYRTGGSIRSDSNGIFSERISPGKPSGPRNTTGGGYPAPAPLSPVLQVMVFNAPEKAEPEPVKAKREKAEPETNGLMTAEEAAQYVGVHIETLRKWVRLGTFPRIPLPGGGKDFRFSKAMINRWAEERAFVPK